MFLPGRYTKGLYRKFLRLILDAKIPRLVCSPIHEALPEKERKYEPLWQSTS